MSDTLYELINQLLCDLTVVQRNIHILHWNLLSENFITQHPYLGDVYETLFGYIDETAEQIRFAGEMPHGSLRDCCESSSYVDLDSMRQYPWVESVSKTTEYLMGLKALTHKIVTIADDEDNWDVVTVFSDHLTYYAKTLYFLKNSRG